MSEPILPPDLFAFNRVYSRYEFYACGVHFSRWHCGEVREGRRGIDFVFAWQLLVSAATNPSNPGNPSFAFLNQFSH